MSDNYYCNPLQCIWKTIQQEKNEQRQLDTICGDLFPLFMEKCPSASSSLFQNTFGDGTALLSIISCKFVRQANEAISEGFDGVSTLLAASNYTKMLTMISALFDVNFHSSISEGLEPMLRIAAIHGIPSVLIGLHDTILRIISNDPLSEYVVSPEVVCATQKHLSILQLFIYHADRKILAAFHNSNGFMSIVRTITVCFTFPFTASSSLTALAQELLTTILKRSVVSDIVCPHSIKEAAGDAIMRVLGGEGGLDTDLLSEASQAQKLSSFLHAIETWHTIISTLGSSPRISFLPLIESMLSLQSVMTAQMRTTQSLFDAFLQCAYRMEISSVASVYIPKKKKGLLSSAFSVARDILHTPHSIKTTKDVHRNAITQPECLEAAALFVIKSSSIEPRMWLASRLLRCVASEGPEPDLVSSILDTCSYKITSFESPLISELYLTIEAVCSTADISRSLSNIAAAVPFLEPSIIYKTFTFFIELAHKGPRMLGVVESCGIVEASCLVIENIANAGEVDAGNAQVVYCLWKVLLQSSSSLRYFTDAEAIMHALRCAVIEPTSPSAEMLHRASRSAIVNLVSYSKESVGVIVKGLLLKPNQKADWRLVSTYLSIFIVVLFGASCIEVAVSWSAIEICLSLLQSVRSSPSYSIDIYLIGSALSLLLPHARFNDSEKYTEMLEAAIPAIIVGSPEVVNLLILVACGESFNSENMGLLQDIFDKVVPIEKILTFPYEALKRGSYTTLVEHASPIILLCKWYDAESCPDKEKVRNVIHYLTKAYKSPINNVEFAKVVVKNEWIELFSQIGDFSPVLAAFIMPRISYNDEVDRKNKISTVLNLWKNAIVSDNHDSVNTITFCESGGAKGTLYLGNSVWPPSDGLSVSGWVYWQADSTIRLKGEVSWNRVMSKNCDYTNFDGRADIWSLSWNCESSDCFHSIRMFVDKEPRVTILSIDSPTCTTNVSLPYISPDEWTHFGMSIQRANSELSFYIDGCMVHNQTVHYPVTASVIQGGFLVTDKININLGFAPHTESYGTTVSIGEFQLFDDVIDSDVVQSVLASRHHTSGSSVGSSVFSLSAPILSQSIVKRLSCMNILTIQKGFLNMKTPDANLIASFHPYAAKTLSDIHINNKYWWLCNMAPFTGDLKLYGRHTTPPSTISSVALYLITQFGPHFWQQWLQDPVVCHDDYLLGVVLEIFAALSYKGSDFAAFASREIYFQFAAVVSINSKLFTSQPNVLEALVKCIISQCPTNTYVPKRVRDNRVKDKKCMLLINGPLAETLLMNWSFLTNITQHAATSLLLSIEELLCVNNTFKKVNAIRLKSFGFVETFVWGLAKVYVAPPLMEHARRIIECFVQCLHSDSEVVLELANVIVATVPNPIEGFGPLLEKIGSFLGPYCTFQIETLRNILLHAIAHAVSFGNFHQIIYPTWFIVLTGRDVHPLTVALTLRVFALLYTQFSVFRIRMEKAGVIKCLMQTLEQHSHQHDVISIVAHMTIGQVPDLMIASCVISDNPTVLIPQTAINPLLLHLIKYLAFSVQENFTTSVRATSMRVCDAFADIRLTRRPARLKYISQLVRSIIRIKKITSVKCSPVTPASISKSSSCTFSATYQTSTATKSFGEVSSEITLSETERRVDLLLCMLNFLRLTSSKYEYIASSLFSYSAGTSLLDSVGWVVLSAMNHSDEHREDSSRPSMPKNSSRDGYSDSSDYDLADIDATLGSCDVFELSLPRFPALLEAALGLFCTLQELHITSYESIYIGAVGIKTSSMVLLLHHILASCPIGVGSEAQSWFSIHVINIWMVNSLKIMRRTSLIGENGTNVTKNMIQNAIYVKDRLISGLPAPPRATANFIASIIDIVSNSDSIKALKEMIRDWAMYILSTEFHSWNSIKVADSIDMFYEYRSLLLAFPFSSSDTTKVFTARLLEISLIHIQSLNNLSDPITRKLAEIWEMMLNVNRSSTVFSSMLIDGGGSTGRNRIDLLHGGFDQLYYTGQVSGNTTESFIKWLVTNRPQISEVLNKNPNINIDVKHILYNPKKHLKWFTRSQEDIMNEEVSQDSKTSDILSSFNQGWEKVVFAGSSIDPSLLEIGKGIQCSHKLTVVRETTENNSVFEEGQSSTVAMYHHRSCIDTHRLYASLKAAQSPVTEMGGTPIGSVISHMYLGLEEPDRSSEVGVYHPSFLSSGSNINPKISSSGKALMKKIILGDVTEARGNPIVVWIGNVYQVFGNDSLICVMAITKDEVVIISSAQFTSEGDLFISSVNTHQAASKSLKKGMMSRMIQRFIPFQSITKVPAPTALNGSSLATFRYSQYYRQLRTEALGKQQSEARVWRLPLSYIVELHHRSFQHQPAAMELVCEDGDSLMVVFLDKDFMMSRNVQQKVTTILGDVAPHIVSETTCFKKNRLLTLQKRWLQRQISNYDYIQAVNDAASRTCADFSQYPVMPWVLSCYNEVHIDLCCKENYRDLSMPVGAIHPTRKAEVRERYDSWPKDDTTPPFHYGTHYSTSAVVMYYMIRMQPFTQFSIEYQGGRLDVADRLFHSISEAWSSCSQAGGRDVKELIPEFFSQGNFLRNVNNIDLGTRRDGVQLGDVILPPWACGSFERFIFVNREAFESNIVDSQLHEWIDLIFGYKQEGEEAREACNIFHHLTYESGLEEAMSKASGEEDRKAIVASVNNFGVTPCAVFRSPHPKKTLAIPTRQQLFLAATTQLVRKQILSYIPNNHCAGHSIHSLAMLGGTVMVSTSAYRAISIKPHHYYFIDWGHSIIVSFRSREEGISVLPRLDSIGLGNVTTFACSRTGNVVCVGTSTGYLVILKRSSWTSQFNIYHIVHLAIRSSVQFLKYFGKGTFFVAQEDSTFTAKVSLWHVSFKGGAAMCFSVNLSLYQSSLPRAVDTSEVVAVTKVPNSLCCYIIARDRSLFVVSSAGSLITSMHLDSAPHTLANITSTIYCDFSSYSQINVFCCGHQDGTLSFWALITDTAAHSNSILVINYHSMISVDTEPITALLADPNTFSIIVGFRSGTVISLSLPQLTYMASALEG